MRIYTAAVQKRGVIKFGAGTRYQSDVSALRRHQAFLGQVPVDLVEELARQPVGLQQVAELQQRCRVRRRLAAQVDTDESTNGLAVVDRVFDTLIRQPKALLGHIYA